MQPQQATALKRESASLPGTPKNALRVLDNGHRPGPARLNDREFAAFRALIFDAAGIHLSDAKRALVTGRLGRRLRHYGFTRFEEYLHLLKGDRDEWQIMVDLLTTNETYFFREQAHFDLLRDRVLPEFRHEPLFRVWSAASSSGEEAYSTAMLLADRRGGRWEVTGTDISSRVVAAASQGLYPLERAEKIPADYRNRYCLRGVRSQEGMFLVDRRLREKVTFRQMNLNGERWPQLGRFHVIFLRNVMIYFGSETKARLVSRITDYLVPGGYLIVGHSESVNGLDDRLGLVRPSVYRKLGRGD